jgi:hypothetical protein
MAKAGEEVSVMRFALATLVLATPLLFALRWTDGWAEQNERVYALLLAPQNFKVDPEVEKRLLREGIYLVSRDVGEPISYDMLRLFHFVVLIASGDFVGFQTPYFVPHEFVVRHLNGKRNIAELHRYVRDGGGLFFSVSMTGAGQETAEGCEELLAPFGIRVLAAQVRDEERSTCNGEYAWTTNIAGSPVTTEVKRLVYPTNMLRWDDAYATVPFVLEDKGWLAVVRGMPGSVSARGLQYAKWIPIEGQSEPVIAAIRQFGRGRIAVLGVAPFYTLWMPFARPKGGWIGESHTGMIDGIFLEKGDEKGKSDGWRLIVNTFKWLAEGSGGFGFGSYTEEAYGKAPVPPSAEVPAWLRGWREENGAKAFKVLLGVRSSFSDGRGNLKEFAEAARKAGYSILVMTETFEYFNPKLWDKFLEECKEASDDRFVVLPGLDIPDPYQNRYLLFGQREFPSDFMLSGDKKAIKEVQYLMLGFGTHFSAIHRPTTTPMVHQLYKFFSGISIYTYRNGKLIDDGMLAYQWHVNNTSQPIPLVVHEVYSPEEVQTASRSGHQLFVFSDTVENAVWYLRAGIQHFWESPALFLVTSGPVIKTLSGNRIVVESDVPITEVRLICNYYTERRWLPKEKRVVLDFYLPPSHLRQGFVFVQDADGRTAISPPLRFGPAARYTWRCSDRQNFFGFAVNYTGTELPDLDISLPAFGTDEGKSLWPHRFGPRVGENLAPLLEFPYASPAVHITDAFIDQRYWRALWEDVAFDAKAQQGTSRSRVYEAHVRYYDFNISEEYREKDPRRPMMLKEVTIRLRMPVTPSGDVFPVFTKVSAKPTYGYFDGRKGEEIEGVLERGFIDLPVGGYADDLVALSPGIRVNANGEVGFAAPKWSNGPLPIGTTWFARYVRLPRERLQEVRTYMGFGARKPFNLKLSRGRLQDIAYVAYLEGEGFGVAGVIEPTQGMTYDLPLFIEGINCNWESAVWREDGKLQHFGVFEGKGIARLDVTKGGRFYAGNVIMAGDPEIRLSILRWDENGIAIEANNPTDSDIETLIETPPEILGRYRLCKRVKIAAGSTVRLEFGRR